MKNLLKLSVVAGLSLAAATSANAGEFGIGAYGSKVGIDGNFQYLGTNIGLKSDLNMSKKDTTVVPTLFYKTNSSVYYLDYIKTEHTGSGVLSRDIKFDDKTYTVGSNVSSSMKLDWGRLGFRTDVTSFGTDNLLNLKLGADLHVIKLNASIQDATRYESHSITFGMPTIGASLDIRPFEKVALYTDVAGMYFGSYGNYVEYDVGVKVDCILLKGGEWKVGYKSKEFDLEASSDEKANLKFSGAYAGFSYRF